MLKQFSKQQLIVRVYGVNPYNGKRKKSLQPHKYYEHHSIFCRAIASIDSDVLQMLTAVELWP
ncbi:hypothetical protein [Dolichospermum sp. UHCC 0352]|uniref:hypothetical protein n=1 Tax=Dolichospermum sp. UHCC 0352 TaxID=2590011 RepID=UPI001C2C48C1|nr:hypothetical protein [Dolichospermum sp. UHCC 0352]